MVFRAILFIMNQYEIYEQPKPQLKPTSIIVTIVLIIINVAAFLITDLTGGTDNAEFMVKCGAVYTPYVIVYGKWYTLITSMFLHFGIGHLANNMIMLFGLGNYMERLMGKIKFIILYFAAGVAGNLVSLAWELYTRDFSVSAGASGAIFGMIGGLLWIVIKNKGRVANLSVRGLIIMIALSLYYGFTSSGIDNAAHLGGLAAGFIVAVILYRKSQKSL